eukprot:782043_1
MLVCLFAPCTPGYLNGSSIPTCVEDRSACQKQHFHIRTNNVSRMLTSVKQKQRKVRKGTFIHTICCFLKFNFPREIQYRNPTKQFELYWNYEYIVYHNK